MDIGISDSHRKQITDGLSHLLANSYVLYLMTHNFHWNVTGPMFRTLHLMFIRIAVKPRGLARGYKAAIR